jgi:hypothetical protein
VVLDFLDHEREYLVPDLRDVLQRVFRLSEELGRSVFEERVEFVAVVETGEEEQQLQLFPLGIVLLGESRPHFQPLQQNGLFHLAIQQLQFVYIFPCALCHLFYYFPYFLIQFAFSPVAHRGILLQK